MAQVLPFNGFYTDSSKKNSSRTCVNYMPVRHDEGSLSQYTLKSTVGMSGPLTLPGVSSSIGPVLSDVVTWNRVSAGITGAAVFAVTTQRKLIATNGLDVEAINMPSSGVFQNLYDVRFAFSTQYMLINTRSTGSTQSIYIYDGTNSPVVTVNLSTTLGGNERIADVANLGSRFLLMSEDATGNHTGKVYYSGINDPLTYTPSGFFTSTEQHSANVGVHVMRGRLLLFSYDGFTVWTNTRNLNNPFKQQKGSGGDVGLFDPMGKCELAGVLYFIGRAGNELGLYAISGSTPQKISTDAVDFLLAEGGSKGFIRCFSFIDSAQNIVAFTFSDHTVCYNTSTGEFHKRSTNGGRWEVIGSGYSEEKNNRQVFIGRTETNIGTDYKLNIGIESEGLGTEFGVQVPRECVTSPFNSDGVLNNVRELAFQTDIDHTLFDPTLDHPRLGLEVSKDFGYTYGQKMFREFENIGENDRLLRFMSIGFFRQAFVFKITTNIPNSHSILKMTAKLQKGFREI